MFTTRCAASAITNPPYLTVKPFDKSLKALPDNSIRSYCGHSPLAKMISSVFFGKLPIDAKPQWQKNGEILTHARSRMAIWAALKPQAPWTPAPGWVEALAKYKPRIGVR